MNKSCFQILLLPVFMHLCVTVSGTDINKCNLHSKPGVEEEKLLSRISPLFGQIFRIEKDGYNYTVGICVDTSKLLGNVSVTKSNSSYSLVLGRRNDTYVMGGDTWVLLKYSGDKCSHGKENQCLGNHSASIYIVCDPVAHIDAVLNLSEEDDCHHQFVLPTLMICEHEQKVSDSTVFLIILSISIFMYFVVGIIYKRLVHNSQGCQQLPHFSFWQRIGALCSDGCNYICRCDAEPEDPWNSITSNFDSGDRDDALLKP